VDVCLVIKERLEELGFEQRTWLRGQLHQLSPREAEKSPISRRCPFDQGLQSPVRAGNVGFRDWPSSQVPFAEPQFLQPLFDDQTTSTSMSP